MDSLGVGSFHGCNEQYEGHDVLLDERLYRSKQRQPTRPFVKPLPIIKARKRSNVGVCFVDVFRCRRKDNCKTMYS